MKKALKIIGIVLGVIALLMVAFFLWLFMPGSTKKIEGVAAQFQPDSSWGLVDENIIPPVTACFNAQCDYLYRRWHTGQIVSQDELKSILDKSGWNLEIKGDCLPKENVSGSGTTLCSAKGVIDDSFVSVSVTGDYHDASRSQVTMTVAGKIPKAW